MARKWIKAVDVMIDDATGALLVAAPRVVGRGLVATTATAAWSVVALPANVEYLDIGLTESAFLLPTESDQAPSTDPPANGCRYLPEGNHRLDCPDCSHLHIMRAGDSDSTVTITAFVRVS